MAFLEFLQNPLNIIFFGFYLRTLMIEHLGDGWAATATFIGVAVQLGIAAGIVAFVRWLIRKFTGKGGGH